MADAAAAGEGAAAAPGAAGAGAGPAGPDGAVATVAVTVLRADKDRALSDVADVPGANAIYGELQRVALIVIDNITPGRGRRCGGRRKLARKLV